MVAVVAARLQAEVVTVTVVVVRASWMLLAAAPSAGISLPVGTVMLICDTGTAALLLTAVDAVKQLCEAGVLETLTPNTGPTTPFPMVGCMLFKSPPTLRAAAAADGMVWVMISWPRGAITTWLPTPPPIMPPTAAETCTGRTPDKLMPAGLGDNVFCTKKSATIIKHAGEH